MWGEGALHVHIWFAQVREGGFANVRDHFSLANAASGLADTLALAVAGEPRLAKQLDLGARALLMDSCAH
jgi:hypothetical protein